MKRNYFNGKVRFSFFSRHHPLRYKPPANNEIYHKVEEDLFAYWKDVKNLKKKKKNIFGPLKISEDPQSFKGFFCLFRPLCVHIQIPPTGYIGLILRSTAVATASYSTFEGTIYEGTL